MFYIQISNGLLHSGHRKRMGEAVWEFMWCIDKVTKIDEDGTGWVLGGKPIKLRELTDEMQVHATTVSRNLNKLQKEGYIRVVRTPHGIRIALNKAKKVFKKDSGNLVDKSEDNPAGSKKRFSTNATRFSVSAKSNIRQLRQETVNKFTSNNNSDFKKSEPINPEGRKKLQELKQALTVKTI